MNLQEQGAADIEAGASQPAPTRQQIQQLQAAMLPIACEMPEAEHFFAPGMYGRRFAMPAGMLVVGKIHKHAHLMMVLKGSAIVVDEFGRYEVSAGFVQESKPGAKRVVLAKEDSVFLTVHLNPSDTKSIDVIESEHIEHEDLPVYEPLVARALEVLQ